MREVFHVRPVFRATPALCVLAMCVFARPAQAQQVRTKILRVELGYSSNHQGSDTGISGAVHFALSGKGGGPFRFEAGLIAGHPYVGLDAGVEVRFPKAAPVGVLVRAGGGLLVEDGFIGIYGRGGGGVEWILNAQVALRGTWQSGYHGDVGGPHLMHFGVDYRW
jgi:hypothetical protein